MAVAELVGTFFLTLTAAGLEVVDVLHPGHIDRTMKAAAPAAVVAAMVYSLGDVSGAHLNPAVTAAFTVRRVFDWRRLPLYWLAQLCGATLAALTLRALFGTVRSVGVSVIHLTPVRAVVVEAIVTALLVIVILHTAHEHSLIGTQAALAVGATLFACGLLAGELTSASMNPARSIGPALVAGDVTDLWVFIVGPLTGAALGLAVVVLVHPHRNCDEQVAAEGE
jgi:aquaporin Z